MAKIEIEGELLDEFALASLEEHYETVLLFSADKKLKKALKRVIEYYGGSVDNE